MELVIAENRTKRYVYILYKRPRERESWHHICMLIVKTTNCLCLWIHMCLYVLCKCQLLYMIVWFLVLCFLWFSFSASSDHYSQIFKRFLNFIYTFCVCFWCGCMLIQEFTLSAGSWLNHWSNFQKPIANKACGTTAITMVGWIDSLPFESHR